MYCVHQAICTLYVGMAQKKLNIHTNDELKSSGGSRREGTFFLHFNLGLDSTLVKLLSSSIILLNSNETAGNNCIYGRTEQLF